MRTSALAAVHEARVAGNGHSEWGLMQPARVKGQGFIVQELPLPLVSSPSAGGPVLGLCTCARGYVNDLASLQRTRTLISRSSEASLPGWWPMPVAQPCEPDMTCAPQPAYNTTSA